MSAYRPATSSTSVASWRPKRQQACDLIAVHMAINTPTWSVAGWLCISKIGCICGKAA